MEEVMLVPVELQVGKETKEVADAICLLIKAFKEGKKVEAVLGNLEALMLAVEGYGKLGLEQKDPSASASRGYLVMKLSEGLEYVPPAPEEPAPAPAA